MKLIFALKQAIVFSAVFTSMVIVSSLQAAELVGSDGGGITIDNNGQATWSVPIEVPSGIAGLQPSLQVSFSSSGGNSYLGQGGVLSGSSSISRCARSHADDGYYQAVQFDDQDALCIDGQRLVLESSSYAYGQQSSVYRTEIESFYQVTLMGGGINDPSSYFSVKNKVGSTLVFGKNELRKTYDTDPLTGVKSVWKIDQLIDLNTNTLSYTYTNIGSVQTPEIQLAQISYGGNTQQGVNEHLFVKIAYEDRPDTQSFWNRGAQFSQTKRIASISTLVGSDVVRRYNLRYDNDTPGGISRINEFEACAGNGDCYRPSKFTYAPHSQPSWQPSQLSVPSALQTDEGKPLGTLVDLNNDGVNDWVAAYTDRSGDTTKQIFLGSIQGWQDGSQFTLPDVLFDYSQNEEGFAKGSLLDINSDGWPDYIQSYQTGSTVTNKTWRNTGSGFVLDASLSLPTSLFRLESNGVITSLAESGDLNADGLVDFVQAVKLPNGDTVQRTWLHSVSNGVHSWSENADFKAPSIAIDFSQSSEGETYAVMQDVNSDGLVDWVQSYIKNGTHTANTWLNDGRKWVVSDNFELPVANINYDLAAKPIAEYIFEDVNSDGLLDLVKALSVNSTKSFDTLINTGNGWQQASEYNAPDAHLIVNANGNTASVGGFVDLNADGQLDFMVSYQDANDNVVENYWLFDKDNQSWQTTSDYSLPALNTKINAEGNGVALLQLADINSDGFPEMFSTLENSQVFTSRKVSDAAFPGILKKTEDSLGSINEMVYGLSSDPQLYQQSPQTAYPYIAYNTQLTLIKEVKASNGVGGMSVVKHSYGGGKQSLLHGGLGFAYHDMSDIAANSKITSYFYQDTPNPNNPRHDVLLVGKVKQTERYFRQNENAAWRYMSKATINYAIKTLGINGLTTLMPYTVSSENISYNVDSTNHSEILKIIETSLDGDDIDSFGNVKKTTEITKNGGGEIELIAESETPLFENKLDAWILGLPRENVKTIKNNLAGDESYTTTGQITFDTKGRVATETLEPGNALEVVKTYGYDNFGNRTEERTRAATDHEGSQFQERFTKAKYTDDGRFPEWVENALGHRATSVYNQKLGKVELVTDANGVSKEYVYDGFGTVVKEAKAHQSTGATRGREIIIPKFCDQAPSSVTCPANAVYYITALDDIGEAPEIGYYNVNGKELMRKTFGFDGSSVVIETQYDQFGRTTSVTQPYFEKDGAPTDSNGKTNYYYDVLSRQIRHNNAEGNNFVTDYQGLTVITTSPGNKDTGQQINSVENNLFGKPIKATDASGFVTEYFYDLRGKLLTTKQTTDANVVVESTINYDPIFGYKTSMNDPDLGFWQYKYNGFGELIEQIDAKNQVTLSEYDVIGRLIERTDNATATDPIITSWSFHNDSSDASEGMQASEKVIIGALQEVTSPDFKRQMFYDHYARPVRVITTIKDKEYTQKTGYNNNTEKVDWMQYPSGLTVRQTYDNYGFPKTVEGADLNDTKAIEYQSVVDELNDKQRQLQAWEEQLPYDEWLQLEALKADYARLGKLVGDFYEDIEDRDDFKNNQDRIDQHRDLLDNIEKKIDQHSNWRDIYAKQIEAISTQFKKDFDDLKRLGNLLKPYQVQYEELKPEYDRLFKPVDDYQRAIEKEQGKLVHEQSYLASLINKVNSHASDINGLAAQLPGGEGKDAAKKAAKDPDDDGTIAYSIRKVGEAVSKTTKGSKNYNLLWGIYSHLKEIEKHLATMTSPERRIEAHSKEITRLAGKLKPHADAFEPVGEAMKAIADQSEVYGNQISAITNRLKPHLDKINDWLNPIVLSHTNVILGFNDRTIKQIDKIFAISGSLAKRRTLHPEKYLAAFEKHLDYLQCIRLMPTPRATLIAGFKEPVAAPRDRSHCYANNLITLDDVKDPEKPELLDKLQEKLVAERAKVESFTQVDVKRLRQTKWFFCNRQLGYSCPAKYAAQIDSLHRSLHCAQMPAAPRRTEDDKSDYWHCPNVGLTAAEITKKRETYTGAYYLAPIITNIDSFRQSIRGLHAAEVDTLVCNATQGTKDDECEETANQIWWEPLAEPLTTEEIEDSQEYVSDPDQYALIWKGETQRLADDLRSQGLPANIVNALDGMMTLDASDIAKITDFSDIESLLLTFERLVENQYKSLGDTGQYLAIQSLIEDVQRLQGRVDKLNAERRNEEKTVYWEAEDINAGGQILKAKYGNDTETQWQYDTFGRINNVFVQTNDDNEWQANHTLVNNDYRFDAIGNLSHREDLVSGVREDFEYDIMNRLRSSTVSGSGAALMTSLGIQNTQYRYDQLGNLKFKSDISDSDYVYGEPSSNAGPHAVSMIYGIGAFQYDDNGNQISGNGRTVDYSAFNKPTRIVKDGVTTDMHYGAERQLVWKSDNEKGVKETFFVGGLYEEDHQAGESIVRRHSISVAGNVIAIVEKTDGVVGAKESYLHKNHQGSVIAISNAKGEVTERRHYDAFGKQRRTLGESALQLADWKTDFVTGIGYTGHQEFAAAGIIHMGGRVFDPEIGRFLSADPYVQAPLNSQSFNRYSYTFNNPLSFTDPSGYIAGYLAYKALKKLWKKIKAIIKKAVRVIQKKLAVWKKNWEKKKAFVKKYYKQIIAVIVVVVAAYFGQQWLVEAGVQWATVGYGTATGAYTATGLSLAGKVAVGAFAGAVSGFVATGSLKGALEGAAFGAVTAGFAGAVKDGVGIFKGLAGAAKTTIKVIGHGIIGGARAVVNGGKFLKGFVSSAFAKFATPRVVAFVGGDQAGLILQGLAVATVGGITSLVVGGDFALGFLSAGVGFAVNYMISLGAYYDAVGKKIGNWLGVFKRVSIGTSANGTVLTPGMGVNLGANVQQVGNEFYTYKVTGTGAGWDIGADSSVNMAIYFGDQEINGSLWEGDFYSAHASIAGTTYNIFLGGGWVGASIGLTTEGVSASIQRNWYELINENQ